MPDLDFAAIKQLSCQGFKTEQEKDSLLNQGFTILTDETTPFEAPAPLDAPDPPRGSPPAPMQQYKAAFCSAFDFLQQHTPAQHSAEYWTSATQDAAAITAQRPGDQLLQGLIMAALEELERQDEQRSYNGGPVQGGLDR